MSTEQKYHRQSCNPDKFFQPHRCGDEKGLAQPAVVTQNSESGVLTEVSALDGAVAEGDAEVVTCLPQLGNGNAVRAADYPRFVIILPFSEQAEEQTGRHSHASRGENTRRH